MPSRISQRVEQVSTGDITAVSTSNGIQGGGTSGALSLTLDTAAKGDVLAGTGSNTAQVLSGGTDTYVLTADSGETTGLIWAAPTTGDVTGVTAGTAVSVSSPTGPVPTVNVVLDHAGLLLATQVFSG